MESYTTTDYTAPASIIIVGSGVFGLATALSLCQDKRGIFSKTLITILEKDNFPSPDAASIGSTRIIRPDYEDDEYRLLAIEAQKYWLGVEDDQTKFGGKLGEKARYRNCNFVEVAEAEDGRGAKVLEDITSGPSKELGLTSKQKAFGDEKIMWLSNSDEIGAKVNIQGVAGDVGYRMAGSICGVVDAKAAMIYLRERVQNAATVEGSPKVVFKTGEVKELIIENSRVIGVRSTNEQEPEVKAELIILAAGAWTPALVPGIGDRLVSLGIATARIELDEKNMEKYSGIPIMNNISSGVFLCPPTPTADPAGGLLELVRYNPGTGQVLPTISPPNPAAEVSKEEQVNLEQALVKMAPDITDPPFKITTRLRWNTETPGEDYLVAYQPDLNKTLFIAAGGHAFKFLPVLGDKVVDVIVGDDSVLTKKWRWMSDVEIAKPELWKGWRRYLQDLRPTPYPIC